MIRLTQKNENFTMYIKMNFAQTKILDFLSKQGYTVKSWLWQYEDTTFPNGTTQHESWTFTATKGNEPQSEANIYTTVFEKEIRKALKLN